MMAIDGDEIEERYLEYGVRNPHTGEVTICEDEEDARLRAETYELIGDPQEVVTRQVFETGWSLLK